MDDRRFTRDEVLGQVLYMRHFIFVVTPQSIKTLYIVTVI